MYIPLLLVLGLAAPAPRLEIVASGKPLATVVVAADAGPAVQDAALELQAYVKKITGATLAIASEDKTPAGRCIWIGRTGRARQAGLPTDSLKPEGFVIKTFADGLIVAGRDDAGTRHGVSTLLEKYCGVRWFMPGELGEVVPKSANLAVAVAGDVQSPAFVHRLVWWAYGRFPPGQREAYALWQLRNKMGGVRLSAGHNLARIVPGRKLFGTHPEYFPLIAGQRRCEEGESNWQPCTSNPAVVRLAVEAALAHFQNNPDAYSFSVSPNDGYGWCMCPECTAQDPPEYRGDSTRGKGRRMLLFANAVARQVAKEFPDKMIAFYAYAGTVEPPADVKAERNVVVALAHYGWCGCNFHPIESSECPPNQKFRTVLDGWARLTDKLFLREYYTTLASLDRGLLRIAAADSIARDIPYLHRRGVIGVNSESVREYGIALLNFYVAAKFLWDPTTDQRALLDDFYTKFYGTAALPMRRYHELLTDAARSIVHQPGAKLTPQLLERCRGLLDDGARSEGSKRDPRLAERVRWSRDYFDYVLLAQAALASNAHPQAMQDFLKKAESLKDTNVIEYNLLGRYRATPRLSIPEGALYAGQPLARTPAPATAAPARFPVLRGAHAFWIRLEAKQALRAEITHRRVGSSLQPIAFGLFGPDRRELARGAVEVQAKHMLAFQAAQPGVHTLLVQPGSNGMIVEISPPTAVLHGTDFHFLGAARRPLSFHVPKTVEQFELLLEGGGGSETAAIDVFDPGGRLAATGSTVGKGSLPLTIAAPPATRGKPWSLVVKPAGQGVTEDVRLMLDSHLAPQLAVDSAALLLPPEKP